MIADLLLQIRLVLSETLSSFRRNNDLAAASSLAFFSAIALIPALFLVTFFLSMAVGSSQEAIRKVQEIAQQFIPSHSQDIVREVRILGAQRGAVGIVNFAVLILTITPLVTALRETFGILFRRKPERPFVLEKLIDVALTVVFLVGIAAIGAAGVALSFAGRALPFRVHLGFAAGVAPFLFMVVTVFLLYAAFSRGVPVRRLFAGAVLSAGLWVAMRPLFHLFLTYNMGYGVAFGSFKSIFIVIIWLYYSLIVLLLGAEFAATLNRGGVLVVKRLVTAGKGVPAAAAEPYLLRRSAGETIFTEGEPGDRMFSVRSGSVTIRKKGGEIDAVGPGRYFGIVSFLLGSPRIATAVAAEDSVLVAITKQNIGDLMREFPEMALALLTELASRQRDTDKLQE